jgi:coenzyme F420-reducing hydrogenase delta subunit
MSRSRVAERITVLLCENSGWKALAELPADPALRGVDFVKIPCSGRVDAGLLLSLLERGSAGVLAVGCPKDNCTFLRGSYRAEKRVAGTRGAWREAGLDEGVVRLELVSSMDTHRLREAVLDFKRYLDDNSSS